MYAEVTITQMEPNTFLCLTGAGSELHDLRLAISFYYRPPTMLEEGNVFTGVHLLTGCGYGITVPGSLPDPWSFCGGYGIPPDTPQDYKAGDTHPTRMILVITVLV